MSESTLQKTEQHPDAQGSVARQQFWRPLYRTESSKEAHTLHVALPGVPKSGVDIALDGDQLTITGHRGHPVPESWKPLYTEMGHRDYRLVVRLNVDVDPDKITAKVEDGMLTLVLPVREEAKPRQISVS